MTKNIFRVPNHHGRLVSENQIEFVTEHYNFDARIMKKHEKPIIQEGKLIIQNEIKEFIKINEFPRNIGKKLHEKLFNKKFKEAVSIIGYDNCEREDRNKKLNFFLKNVVKYVRSSSRIALITSGRVLDGKYNKYDNIELIDNIVNEDPFYLNNKNKIKLIGINSLDREDEEKLNQNPIELTTAYLGTNHTNFLFTDKKDVAKLRQKFEKEFDYVTYIVIGGSFEELEYLYELGRSRSVLSYGILFATSCGGIADIFTDKFQEMRQKFAKINNIPLNIEEQCCKASLHLDEIQNKVTEIIKRKTVTADEFLIEELEKDNTLYGINGDTSFLSFEIVSRFIRSRYRTIGQEIFNKLIELRFNHERSLNDVIEIILSMSENKNFDFIEEEMIENEIKRIWPLIINEKPIKNKTDLFEAFEVLINQLSRIGIQEIELNKAILYQLLDEFYPYVKASFFEYLVEFYLINLHYQNELDSAIEKIEQLDPNIFATDSESIKHKIRFIFCRENRLMQHRVFSIDKDYGLDYLKFDEKMKQNTHREVDLFDRAMKENYIDFVGDFTCKDLKRSVGFYMNKAINANRHEFVNLLFKIKKIDLKEFLATQELYSFYSNAFLTEKNETISFLKMETDIKIRGEYVENIEKMGKFIEKIANIDDKFNHILSEPDKRTRTELIKNSKYNNEMAANELFLFSLLMGRFEMAKVFWKKGCNTIYLALLASSIFKIFAEKDDEYTEHHVAIAEEFEKMAGEVLERYYKCNQEEALNLLCKPLKMNEIFYTYNKNSKKKNLIDFKKEKVLTCLEFAVSAELTKFISHPACQKCLNFFWYDKLLPKQEQYLNTYPKIILSSLILLPFPIFAPFLLKYKFENNTKKKNYYSDEASGKVDKSKSCLICWKSTCCNEVNTQKKKKKKKLFQNVENFSDYTLKFLSFIGAPCIKNIYYLIFHVLFLLLFSYILLSDFYPVPVNPDPTNLGLQMSIPEIIIFIWVSLFGIDEFREIYQQSQSLAIHFSSLWNSIEFISLFLYFVGYILRWIPNNNDTFLAARVILSIDIIFWFLKLLSFYTVVEALGPKILMIQKMFVQLVYFIFIIIVFMLAFGVSTQALLFPNQDFDANLIGNIVLPSYFILVGDDYSIRTVIMNTLGVGLDGPMCNLSTITDFSGYKYNGETDCPNKIGAIISLIILMVYVVILIVLLINILIAVFFSIYEEVMEEQSEIYKFQFFSMIEEYYNKPIFAPPFSLFVYIFAIFYFLWKLIKLCSKKQKKSSTLNKEEQDELRNMNKVKKRINFNLISNWTDGNFYVKEVEKEVDLKINELETHLAYEFIKKNEDNENKNTEEMKIEKEQEQEKRLELEEQIKKVIGLVKHNKKDVVVLKEKLNETVSIIGNKMEIILDQMQKYNKYVEEKKSRKRKRKAASEGTD